MTYRCLIHIPTATYAGPIAGDIADWSGLAKTPNDWRIVVVDLEPMQTDYEVQLTDAVTLFASKIDGALIGGA